MALVYGSKATNNHFETQVITLITININNLIIIIQPNNASRGYALLDHGTQAKLESRCDERINDFSQ